MWTLSLSNADDFLFFGVMMRLWPIGLCNPHEIVSVTVNLNSMDTARHFVDAISPLEAVLYLGRPLRVVTGQKGVIYQIPSAKLI